jgi:SET domain-containing protein
MGLVKRRSKIHGFGIFTDRDIPKGKVFYEVPLGKLSNKSRPRFAFIGDGLWVNDPRILNWVNHSCDANTFFDIADGRLVLVARRDIEADEEITCDYNKTEKGGKKVLCKCGSRRCRGSFLRIE